MPDAETETTVETSTETEPAVESERQGETAMGAGSEPGGRSGALRVLRRLVLFDLRGMQSLWLLARRRRHGVPPGATAVPYEREERGMLLAFLFVVLVEGVATELLLRGVGAPEWLRGLLLLLDVYGVIAVLAIGAARATRPHVVSDTELRIRSGAFFDLRIPLGLITSVRTERNFNEEKAVALADGRCAVSAGSQTNVVVELAAPVTVTRPLGRRAEAQRVHFFADDPAAAAAALRNHLGPVAPVG
ncbi:hypothetical protein ACIA8O_34590 [Kitasatospora sp. NPDC051853]|uniref:hypothetical protein n=1 Tax=Kitasatospora sp. NPDC051853 TaxID=3364058 RepID=UPI0037BD1AAF